MTPRSLPLIGAVVVLLVVGIGAAYVLSRPAPEPGTPAPPPGEAVNEVSDAGPYHQISATYPGTTPLSAAANVKAVASMEGFVNAAVAEFKQNSGLLTLTAEDIAMLGLGGERKYELEIEYTTYSSPSTISYVFTIYENTMGAHPNAYYRTFTFDAASGEELLIGDLFTSDAYLAVLSEGSRTQIKERIGADLNEQYLNDGTNPAALNFQFFYLEESELVIVYPPYQVGPWAIGTQEARFETSALANLKAEYR